MSPRRASHVETEKSKWVLQTHAKYWTMRLGAQGGVDYRDDKWEDKLLDLLPAEKVFDTVVDGAGGDVAGTAATV